MENYIFDNNGNYKGVRGSVAIENELAVELSEETIRDFSICLKPVFLNGKIAEGATEEEVIAFKTPICQQKLIDCVLHLRDRALISSIMKEDNITYLKGQSETYKEKYKVANQYCLDQTINDIEWYNAIVTEMHNTNKEYSLIGTDNELTIPSFMNYIKQAFETGLERSKKFHPSIEVFRCKAKDLYVLGQFERFEQMIAYAYALPPQIDLSEVDGFVNHINQI